MTGKEAIYARHSVRSYSALPLRPEQLQEAEGFAASAAPLRRSVKTDLSFLSREEFEKDFYTVLAHKASHYLVIRSSKDEGYLENAGFIGEQIVLGLTSVGIGSCWLGRVRPKASADKDLLPFAAVICLGGSDSMTSYTPPIEAKRILLPDLVLGRISDPDLLPLIEAGRLAPSDRNSQPVRYITEKKKIYVYRRLPLIPHESADRLGRIAVGAALANMYVSSDECCVFIKEMDVPMPEGRYIYEYTVFTDRQPPRKKSQDEIELEKIMSGLADREFTEKVEEIRRLFDNAN